MALTETKITGAYPLDSDPTPVGIDEDTGTPIYDRAYNAADLRRYMRLAVTDGVWPDYLDELAVTSSGGAWSVGAGAAMAAGLLIPVEEAAQVLLQSDIPTGSYAFVIVAGRFDTAYRDGAVYARVQESPEYTPVRTDSTWELVLARIDSRGEMRDYRLDNAMCGPVSPVMQPDTESFMLSLETALSQFDLQVGTVTALPSGSTPTVEVVKPDTAGEPVTINYGIPRGEKGEDGDKIPAVFVQATEPSAGIGAVWLVDDDSTIPHEITGIKVYETEGLWPSSSLYPSSDLYPGGAGQWVDHVLSPSILASTEPATTGAHFA